MTEQAYIAKQGWGLWECEHPVKAVHVAPVTGPQHTFSRGVLCWCEPQLENPRESAMSYEMPLVIHNRPQ